VLISVEDLRQL